MAGSSSPSRFVVLLPYSVNANKRNSRDHPPYNAPHAP